MIKSINARTRLALLVVCLLFGCSHASFSEETEFSEAETLLWLTDQLRSIDKPLTLAYHFERSGTFEPGFTDSVRFVVDTVKSNGMKAASLEFFTGERRFEVPPSENTNVNPVLKVYLQGDVYEMNRLTDTEGESRERWRYFQRRIKYALAEAATVEDVKVMFEGTERPAKRVSFQPYVKDPKRSLFEQFADKSYFVTVSDDIPGYLFRIETVIPGSQAGSPPLIREVLQLVDVLDPSAAKNAGL